MNPNTSTRTWLRVVHRSLGMKRDLQTQWKQGKFVRCRVIGHLEQQARLIFRPFVLICQDREHEPDVPAMR